MKHLHSFDLRRKKKEKPSPAIPVRDWERLPTADELRSFRSSPLLPLQASVHPYSLSLISYERPKYRKTFNYFHNFVCNFFSVFLPNSSLLVQTPSIIGARPPLPQVFSVFRCGAFVRYLESPHLVFAVLDVALKNALKSRFFNTRPLAIRRTRGKTTSVN